MKEAGKAESAGGALIPGDKHRGEFFNGDFVAHNPLLHSDWDSTVGKVPGATLFHSSIWARVLRQSYGHEPVYFCQGTLSNLRQLLPVMEVRSPWTGRRGVSLPFTDLCAPLSISDQCHELYNSALEYGRAHGWRYLECRGGNWDAPGVFPSLEFWGHYVDLESGEEALFQSLDGAVRRGVRKAKRASLQIEFSNRPEAMDDFYRLHCATRRRHGVPPQPRSFFSNLARLVLGQGYGSIATARVGSQPVAASVFLHFGREVIYKFGASDYSFQELRANNLVMWEAIRRYAANGFKRLHLGRTSLNNEGLRRFKLAFGATEETIRYFKYDIRKGAFIPDKDLSDGWLSVIFRRLPASVLRLVGSVMYPHLS